MTLKTLPFKTAKKKQGGYIDGLLPIFLLKETLSVKYTSKIVRTHSGITDRSSNSSSSSTSPDPPLVQFGVPPMDVTLPENHINDKAVGESMAGSSLDEGRCSGDVD